MVKTHELSLAEWLFWTATLAVISLGFAESCRGASYRTRNFVVENPSVAVAQQVAECAEQYRSLLWQLWFGNPSPADWPAPCRVQVTINRTDGGGATSFVTTGTTAVDFQGTWQGKLDRMLDSVVPHEVLHTVFATEIGKPIPRWIDEGLCSSEESPISKRNYQNELRIALKTQRAFPTKQLMGFAEYPPDFAAFYAQSQSMAEWLLAKRGRSAAVAFMRDGYRLGWQESLRQHYGYESVLAFQNEWLDHIKQHSVYKPVRRWIAGHKDCRPDGRGGNVCVWIRGHYETFDDGKQAILPGRRAPPVQAVSPPSRTAEDANWQAPSQVAETPRAQTCDCAQQIAAISLRVDQIAADTQQQLEALKASLPPPPDLSGYVRVEQLPQQPDLSGYARIDQILKRINLEGYAKREELKEVESHSSKWHESLLTKVNDLAASGVAVAKGGSSMATAYATGGPIGLGIVVAGWLISRRREKRAGGHAQADFH